MKVADVKNKFDLFSVYLALKVPSINLNAGHYSKVFKYRPYMLIILN